MEIWRRKRKRMTSTITSMTMMQTKAFVHCLALFATGACASGVLRSCSQQSG